MGSADTIDRVLGQIAERHCDGPHTLVVDGDELGDYLSCVNCPYVELLD